MATNEEISQVPVYLRDVKLTQECQELLPSLPRERGWVKTNLYKYQGFWLGVRQLQGAIACQRHFQAQDSDILLVTSPKSGTTWLKAMAFALINRKDYTFTQDHPLNKSNPHMLVPFLDLEIYFANQNPDLSSYPCPRLFGTHLPFVSIPKSVHESACKIVYLCRNPKDTFVSLWHFTNKLRLEKMGNNALEDVFDRFCRGMSHSGPFWDHVLGYWKASLENPDKVLFLKYEDLKENPTFYLRKLAEFLGCPFSREEEELGIVDAILSICSFDNLRNLEVNKSGNYKLFNGMETNAFFRRGEVGDWKNFLTSEMVDRMDSLGREKFHPFGLEL